MVELSHVTRVGDVIICFNPNCLRTAYTALKEDEVLFYSEENLCLSLLE